MIKTVVCLLALLPSFSYGQSASTTIPPAIKNVARDRSYHVVHYNLTIQIDEKAKSCRGDVTITLVPLRAELTSLDIDAAEMTIEGVRVEGKSSEIRRHGDTLTVDLGKSYGLRDTLIVAVSYNVIAPKVGLYFVKADSGYDKKQTQVWSNGETTENHHWFPCYDYPNDMSTSEMTVTVREDWTAISNGRLIDVRKDPKRHTATYHWFESKPHVSYLISLVAGEYVEVKDSWGSVPLSYFVYKHQKEDALRSFGKSAKIMEFYSSHTGYPYAWEKYSQTVVQDYIVGGQENVSATTLSDGTIHDARAHLDYSSDGLVAHEMAHQWFGDLMTCRDWSHLWLNEGFASYFDILFQEYDKGTDVALKSIVDAQHNIVTSDFAEKRRPPVFNAYTDPNTLFDNRIYGKGACVLHMLRSIVGDELFWKSIQLYVRTHAHQPVETNDFKIAVEEATGYNLHWFFDEWIYKAGYPEFEVAAEWDNAAKAVLVNVKQTQKTDSLTGLFTMPVDIELWVHDTPEVHRVTVAKAEETFSIPAYQKPQLVLFDKGSRILKKVSFRKSADEWMYQLRHAEYGVDRIAAIEELRWQVDSASITEAIAKAAVEDRFPDVRLEAVWALSDAKRTDISATLLQSYGDRDARVRAASLSALKNYRTEAVLEVLKHAFEKDSSYNAVASAMTSLMKADTVNAKTYAKAGLQRSSFRESIRIAALRGLADVHDDEAFGLVRQSTQYGIDRNVRIEAMSLMARKWKEREEVVPFLITMTADPSLPVRRAAAEMLGNSGNPSALAPLKHIVESGGDERLVKISKESIEKITKVQQEHDSH